MVDVRAVAEAAARAAGDIVRNRADDIGRVRAKDFATDLVTATDIAAGVAAVRAVQRHDPSAVFVVEESEVYQMTDASIGDPSAQECWIIDPVDGTTSFVHGFPCYSVSVAYVREGQPVAGAVYNVALDEMNSAAVGAGASRNGVPITVSDASSLTESLLVTGFPYDRGRALDVQLAVLGRFLRAGVHGLRRDGSAAVDCCHVAAGRCDGFWEYGLKVWDMAAGVVVCREAGAEVTDVSGDPWTWQSASICVANPRVHAEMLAVIREVSAALDQ